MIIFIFTIIIAFVAGFILRGYIIDKNHNATLLNHSSDVSRFLKESMELKNKITYLRKRNKILENRISALIFLVRNISPKKQHQTNNPQQQAANAEVNSAG